MPYPYDDAPAPIGVAYPEPQNDWQSQVNGPVDQNALPHANEAGYEYDPTSRSWKLSTTFSGIAKNLFSWAQSQGADTQAPYTAPVNSAPPVTPYTPNAVQSFQRPEPRPVTPLLAQQMPDFAEQLGTHATASTTPPETQGLVGPSGAVAGYAAPDRGVIDVMDAMKQSGLTTGIDDAEAARVAKQRLEAAGGDIQKALSSLGSAAVSGPLRRGTVADVMLNAAAMAPLPIVGAGGMGLAPYFGGVAGAVAGGYGAQKAAQTLGASPGVQTIAGFAGQLPGFALGAGAGGLAGKGLESLVKTPAGQAVREGVTAGEAGSVRLPGGKPREPAPVTAPEGQGPAGPPAGVSAPAAPELTPPGRAGIDRALSIGEANVTGKGKIALTGKPREAVVAQTARQGTAAAEYSNFRSQLMPVADDLTTAWAKSEPKYIGPAENPAKGTLVDFLENGPTHYTGVSPELQAAKTRWGQVSQGQLDYVRANYEGDIKPFTPNEGGVYVHHMETQAAREAKSIGSSRSTASVDKLGIQKERGYKTIGERMQNDKTFQPETNIHKIADDQAQQMAELAARNVYKAGIGGKTRLEVMQELHPELAKRWEGLHKALNGLRSTMTRIDQKTANAIDGFLKSDMEAENFTELQDVLSKAKVGANPITGQPGRNYGKTSAQVRGELKKVRALIDEIRPAWRTSGVGDYVLDPVTRRYMTPELARASRGIGQTSIGVDLLDKGLSGLEESRIISLGAGDFSPVTIGQGMLGAAGHPDILARNIVGLAKAAKVSSEELWAGVDKANLDLYQQVQGYSVYRTGGLGVRGLERSEVGRGLERLSDVQKGGKLTAPVRAVGRMVRGSNEATSKIVEYGRFKAWESDYNLLRQLNPKLSAEQAAAEAGAGVNAIAPQLNLTTSGISPVVRRVIGAPVNSAAFVAAPFRLARDMTAGITQLSRAIATGKLPPQAWQSLQGRQQIALIRGTMMLGTLSGVSAATAALFGDKPFTTPGQRAMDAINPLSSDFWTVKVPGGGSIPIGGPFRSATTAVRTGINEGPLAGSIKFARSKLQTGIGTPLALIANRDYRGQEIRGGPELQQVRDAVLFGLENANVMGSQLVQGAREGGLSGALTQGASGMGGFNYYEPSTFDQRSRALEQDIKSGQAPATYLGADGQQHPVTSFYDLKEADQRAFNERHANLTEQIKSQATGPLKDLYNQTAKYDARMQQIEDIPEPQAWRDARTALNQERQGALQAVTDMHPTYFAELDKKPNKTMEELALDDYHKAIEANTNKGLVNWDGVDRAVAGLSVDEQTALADYRLIGKTPRDTEYRQALQQLDPYFAARDAQWEKIREKNPQFKDYATFDEYKTAREQMIFAKNPNVPVEVLKAALQGEFNTIQEGTAAGADQVLSKNLGLVPLLSKWGFYVPAKYRNLSPPAKEFVR